MSFGTRFSCTIQPWGHSFLDSAPHRRPPLQRQWSSSRTMAAYPSPPVAAAAPTAWNALDRRRFDAGPRLGKGAYGEVREYHDRLLASAVAIKRVPSPCESTGEARRILREIAILRAIDNPFVVKLHSVFMSSALDDVYLVFEKLDGDLSHALKAARPHGGLGIDRARRLITQLLSALRHLHALGVIHRDIKPQNILLRSSDDQLKLCDFGLARALPSPTPPPPHSVLSPMPAPLQRSLSTHVVTRWYRAPELLLHAKVYDQGVDIFSAGCVFAEMLTGTPLLHGKDADDALAINQLKATVSLIGRPSNAAVDGMIAASAMEDSSTPHPSHRDGIDRAKYRWQMLEALRGMRLHSVDSMDVRTRLRAQLPTRSGDDTIALLEKMLRWSTDSRITAASALRNTYIAWAEAHAPHPSASAPPPRPPADWMDWEDRAHSIPLLRKMIRSHAQSLP